MNRELEQLGERIAEQAAHLDAATHRLLTDLREFDERGGWRTQGATSCAHWLAWRIGWDLVTARDRVRVARKLSSFPSIDDALRRGEVSYSKARAMLRVATPANELLLLDHARLMTASQLENTCRGYALVQRHAQDAHPASDEQRRYVRRRDTEDGMVKIEAVLHPDEAELVWTMLTRAATALAHTGEPASRSHDSAESPRAAPPISSGALDRVDAPANPSPDGSPRSTDDSPESPRAASAVSSSALDRVNAAANPSPDASTRTVDDSAEPLRAAPAIGDSAFQSVNATANQLPDRAPTPINGSPESPRAAPAVSSGAVGLDAAVNLSPDASARTVDDSAESPRAAAAIGDAAFHGVHATANQLPDRAPTPIDDSPESPRAAPVIGNSAFRGVHATANQSPDASARPIATRASSRHVRVWRRCDCAESWETLSQRARAEPLAMQPNGDPCGAPPRSLLDRLLDEADELRGAAHHAAQSVPAFETTSSVTDRSTEACALPAASAAREASATEDGRANMHASGASVHEASTAGGGRAGETGLPGGSERRPAMKARRRFNRADALVSLAQAYLRGDRPYRSPIEVTLTIPRACLQKTDGDGEGADPVEVGELGASFVSRDTARRLSCDAGVVEVIEDEHGAPLSVGRKRRTITGGLKRALHRRDRGCTFPGCTHRIFLEGHHIRHWADGGDTSLSNALLLCSLHHRFVHEYGFTVELGADGRPRFRDAGGREVAAVPAPPTTTALGWSTIQTANAPLSITAATIAGPWDGTPVDYGRITGHLASLEHGRDRPHCAVENAAR